MNKHLLYGCITALVAMRSTFKRILRIATGIVLILAGILGLVVPILPGWILVLLGIVLLGPNTQLAKRLTQTFRRLNAKFPYRKIRY